MKAVLKDKFDSIAYLPLDQMIERITGRPTYQMDDLKKITKYQFYKDGAEEPEKDWKPEWRQDVYRHRDWFWEIFSDFDAQMRAEYLKFVWGRSRLPVKITTEEHKFALHMEHEVFKHRRNFVIDENGRTREEDQGETRSVKTKIH